VRTGEECASKSKSMLARVDKMWQEFHFMSKEMM
jgi:hypothetical protein